MLIQRLQRAIRFAALLSMVAVGGCARPLPTYPDLSPGASLQTIAARLETVHSISCGCDVTLTDAQGDSVQCDGALVAEKASPDRFRLRAWKFDRAVFDLTVINGETWIATPSDPEIRERLKQIQNEQADRIAEAIWLLGPDFFRRATPLETQSTSDRLVARGRAFDQEMMCDIDRRTLTPRRFYFADEAGNERGEIRLSQYRMINGIPWPTRLSFSGKPGAIDLRLIEVELNGMLAENAFKPPPRAVRQP